MKQTLLAKVARVGFASEFCLMSVFAGTHQ